MIISLKLEAKSLSRASDLLVGEAGTTVTLTMRKVDGDMLSTTLCRSLHALETYVIQECALVRSDSINLVLRT